MTNPIDQTLKEMEEFALKGITSVAEAAHRQQHPMLLLQPADAPSVEPGQWPRGLIHRSPKAIDGDRKSNVQVLTTDGWELARWDDVVAGTPWQHTPSWKLPERADDLLSQLVVLVGTRQPITFEMQELVREIRGALRGEP